MVSLQVLPPLWDFPKITAKQLIDKWYVGDKRAGVPKSYYLTAKHAENLGTKKNKGLGRMNLRQMKNYSGIGMVTIVILNMQRWYGRLLVKLYFVSMVQKTGKP